MAACGGTAAMADPIIIKTTALEQECFPPPCPVLLGARSGRLRAFLSARHVVSFPCDHSRQIQ